MRKNKTYSTEEILETMKAQFGDAARAYWVYDDDLCPRCLKRKIDEMMYEGKNALSINAFMYRERGVLIAYLLCGQCATDIMAHSKYGPTSMHKPMEENLISAYLRHLN